MAGNIEETSRTLDLVPVNCSPFIFVTFLPSPSPAFRRRFIPFSLPAGNSKSQIAAGDTCKRARGEDRRCKEGGRRTETRTRWGGGEGEKDREKAETNGVSWPKDAKLPKRSTRKA